MQVTYIVLDDHNPLHRELSIYRTGIIQRICMDDAAYKTYGSLEVDGHNYAACFHYGLVESLNRLPFLSESDSGLESGEEALLHRSRLAEFLGIAKEALATLDDTHRETILVGWQQEPVAIAYLRALDAERFAAFLISLLHFIEESELQQYDLEFLW